MTKEELKERFGNEWVIHTFLMIGVAASRRRQRLTPEEEASGMVLVLLAADLEELADKLAGQLTPRMPVTRLSAHAIDGIATPMLGWRTIPGP